MRPLCIAHVREARDTVPVPVVTTWPKLSARLTRVAPCRPDLCPPSTDAGRLRALKSCLPAWIPAAFRPDGRRVAADVVDLHLLVLDYDGGATIEDERWRWREFAHCGHTSWSHAMGDPKFRIVLPLAAPVAAFWWARVWEWAQAFTGHRIDEKTRNPDRIYFLPALKGPASPWFSWVNDGPWLAVEGPELPATRAELEQQRRADAMRAVRDRRPYENPTREAERQARLLREDPPTREAWALARGAKISARTQGRIATGITCPACGDRSVWLAIDVIRATGASCNHQRTCGWHGPLTEIG